MEGPNWQEPFVLIFEWGMFILGWGIVVVLSVLAVVVAYAFIKAAFVVAKKKRDKKSSSTTDEERINKIAEQVAERFKSRPGSLDDNPPKI